MSTPGIIETSTAPKSATTTGRLQGIHTATASLFAGGCKRRRDNVNALQPARGGGRLGGRTGFYNARGAHTAADSLSIAVSLHKQPVGRSS